MNSLDAVVLQYWSYCAVFLAFKMFFNSAVQGVYRVRGRTYTRPEDAKFFGKGVITARQDLPIVQRASACWRNDLENIPIFLILGLGFALAGGPRFWAGAYFLVFCLARVLHTIFYLLPRQPHRNLAFQLGTLCWVSLAIHLLLLF